MTDDANQENPQNATEQLSTEEIQSAELILKCKKLVLEARSMNLMQKADAAFTFSSAALDIIVDLHNRVIDLEKIVSGEEA